MGYVVKLKSRSKKNKSARGALPLGDGLHISCRCISLGTGSFSSSCVLSLAYSNKGNHESCPDRDELDPVSSEVSPVEKPRVNPKQLERKPSRTFIRTADLDPIPALPSELAEDELIDHVHRPSPNPPPSTIMDLKESWVALDDGHGSKAPLADATIAALLNTALDASLNKDMWTANGATTKLLKSTAWKEIIYTPYTQVVNSVPHARGSRGENDVLVWSGQFRHQYHGHDLPAIRCEAIVNFSPKSLMNLLMDSTRVKEYNKMSIGRDDVMVLQEGENRLTKIVVAKTRPPMLGKTLVVKNLLHMEELTGPAGKHVGYAIVSRAIVDTEHAEAVGDPKIVQSEMLMGLNVLRAIDGEPDRCIMINLNHFSSPMIPMMLAKRMGLSAAVNYINDIRALAGTMT